jgi:hypothetical protein
MIPRQENSVRKLLFSLVLEVVVVCTAALNASETARYCWSGRSPRIAQRAPATPMSSLPSSKPFGLRVLAEQRDGRFASCDQWPADRNSDLDYLGEWIHVRSQVAHPHLAQIEQLPTTALRGKARR